MGHFLKTLISGAAALFVLCAVGHKAYDMGYEMAKKEDEYNNIGKKSEGTDKEKNDKEDEGDKKETKEKSNPIDIFSKAKNKVLLAKNVVGTVWHTIRHPEKNKAEVYLDEGNIHVLFKTTNFTSSIMET